jgi:hypothetical protein
MSIGASNRKVTAVMAGVLLVAALSATVWFPSYAAAQNGDGERRIGIAHGLGVAVNSDTEEGTKSVFHMLIRPNDDEDTEEKEYELLRGMLGIKVDDERVRYTMVPDTWDVAVSEEDETFEASGQVENEDGDEFDVQLTGTHGIDIKNGAIWVIEGSFEGEDVEYELFYIALTRTPTYGPPRNLSFFIEIDFRFNVYNIFRKSSIL